MFSKKFKFYISPSVAKNSQGYYWFDIRQATLEFISANTGICCGVIVRIVPDLFVYIEWAKMEAILENPKKEKNGLKKWEFLLQENFTIIKNRNSEARIFVSHRNKYDFELDFDRGFF